jgi:hypothetical protein
VRQWRRKQTVRLTFFNAAGDSHRRRIPAFKQRLSVAAFEDLLNPRRAGDACYLACVSHAVIVIGAVGLAVVLVCSIIGTVALVFRRHDPARAAASVTIAANTPFELQLPGSRGKVFFRFDINGDTDCSYDLLVSGEIFHESGRSRTFCVKTSKQSRIAGAGSAQLAGTTYAVSCSTGSVLLATVEPGDRVVRGVAREHPKKLLRRGWVYQPRSRD